MKFKLLTVIVLTITLSLFSIQNTTDIKVPQFKKIVNDIYTRGYARVMVELKVREYDKLISISNSYKSGQFYNSDILEKNLAADIELKAAIFSTANKVFSKLGDKEYKINHDYQTLPLLALDISHDALTVLKNLEEVKNIFMDRLSKLPKIRKHDPDNPLLSNPQLKESVGVIGADVAWDLGYSGTGWYVAILDTGIRSTHEFFTGKTIVEACFSRERHCPNGKSQMTGSGAAIHHSSDYDGYDHGTHVSGIAAGNSSYRKRYGVAKDANLIAVNVFSRFGYAECGGSLCVLSWDSDQLKGLEYVYLLRNQYKIGAVNMSLGSEDKYTGNCDSGINAPIKKAIDNLKNVGIATVIASGNEGHCDGISSPACISSAVAVGASTKLDVEWAWSNWKDGLVNFLAPGQNISSSTGAKDDSYSNWNGTSMATPHVAGVFTLLRQYQSSMTVNKILSELKKDNEEFLSKCSNTYYKRRIDVGATLSRLVAIVPPANFQGSLHKNYSLLQTEYIHLLTWEPNPLNTSKNLNIVKYKIYKNRVINENLLVELNSDVLEYLVRMVDSSQNITYYITATDDRNRESSPAAFSFTAQD